MKGKIAYQRTCTAIDQKFSNTPYETKTETERAFQSSFASMFGIASHAPGGLGVFEATILQGVGGSQDAVLASLLIFRGVYYLVPFIAAMAMLGGVEAVRRWRSLREAMSARSDD